jgi:hypothetical protein
MNDPTCIREQARQWGDAEEKRAFLAATARRCACVLALVILFLTTGVGSVPNPGTGEQGLELRMASKPARAETLADGGVYYKELLSARTRHKTH